jgi:hypothetical protein
VDWLRPLDAGVDRGFGEAGDPGAGLLAISTGGALTATFGATRWSWTSIDAPGVVSALPDEATDVVYLGHLPVIATAAGLVWGDDLLDVGGIPARLAMTESEVWVTVPDSGRLVALGPGGDVIADVAVDGLLGPVTVDAAGRVWVAVEDGLAVVDDGAEVARHATTRPLDLVAQASGEIVLLQADGRVDVRFDETALPSGAPLAIAVAAFFENPRSQSDVLACTGDTPSFRTYMDSALANRAWLDDVPATVMLGVTPGVARRAVGCEMGAGLLETVEAERTEVGVLFHKPPSCTPGDQACVNRHAVEEYVALPAAHLAPTWSSGASAWDLGGGSWVEATLSAGAPARHLFFGQAARDDIPADDLRAKEPLPWQGTTAPTAWSESSDVGSATLYPGMPISGFLLGGCENLLEVECGRVDAGGGPIFDADDIGVLSLLLHRALYLRSAEGPDTWYFHLPAIELYDYTDGCSRAEDGVWTGPGCQAGLLQAWLFDVHARFVLGGVAAWTLPTELPTL